MGSPNNHRELGPPHDDWRRAIKEHRLARNWSQAELGRRARPARPISHTTISGVESENPATQTDPQASTLEDIARAFGLTLAQALQLPSAEQLTLLPPTPSVLPERYRQLVVAQIARDVGPEVEKIIAAAIAAWQQLTTEPAE